MEGEQDLQAHSTYRSEVIQASKSCRRSTQAREEAAHDNSGVDENDALPQAQAEGPSAEGVSTECRCRRPSQDV
eukprot:4127993-Pyramimonas_sp.AAC.1